MPEGPSIVILRELAAPFIGQQVIAVTGNTKVQKERALNQTVLDFKSWGKHFLICIEKGDTHEIRAAGTESLRTLNFYVPPAYKDDETPLPAGEP